MFASLDELRHLGKTLYGLPKQLASKAGHAAWAGLKAEGAAARAAIKADQAAFALAPEGQKLKVFGNIALNRGIKLASTRNLMLAGAGVGYFAGGEDHRLKGMALGAAGGLGAKAGLNLYQAKQALKNKPVRSMLLKSGLITAGVMAPSLFTGGYADPQASAHYSPDSPGGYMTTPGEGPDDAVHDIRTGVKHRQSLLAATGNLVLGAHGMRHG